MTTLCIPTEYEGRDICCIQLNVNQKSKKYLSETVYLILTLEEETKGQINRWNVNLKTKMGGHRTFLKKNEKIETDDKYLYTREEMLEYVLLFYAH